MKALRGGEFPVGRADVRVRGGPPRDAEVVARERLPVGRGHVLVLRRGGGHLEIAEVVAENDCPWDKETCDAQRRRAATSRC